MQSHTFLSTLSLRRATARCQQHRHSQRISIHALLAESDGTGAGNCWPVPHFYPRSPCGERPPCSAMMLAAFSFLSTLSLRRATGLFQGPFSPEENFYPRSPCGERLMNSDILSGSCYFYPRSPCGERPGTACMGNQEPYAYFYPRSPCGERRWPRRNRRKRIYNFYPRSPCGERQATSTQASPGRYFYPRSPCGERHAKGNLVKPYTEFLSTLSLRRATKNPNGSDLK